VPSPSMKGRIGLSGTTSLPSAIVIRAPSAGGTTLALAGVDMRVSPRGAQMLAQPFRAGSRAERAARVRDSHDAAPRGGSWGESMSDAINKSGAAGARPSVWRQMCAVRPIDPEEGGGKSRLKQVLGPAALTAIGLGATIGTGIFVLTGQVAA